MSAWFPQKPPAGSLSASSLCCSLLPDWSDHLPALSLAGSHTEAIRPSPLPACTLGCLHLAPWPSRLAPHSNTPQFLSLAKGLLTVKHPTQHHAPFLPSPLEAPRSPSGLSPSSLLPPLSQSLQSPPCKASRTHCLHCSWGSNYALPCNSSI